MAELFLRKQRGRLYEVDEDYEEISNRLPIGTPLRCEIWKERNYQNHKRFFAFIKYVWENSDQQFYQDMDSLRKEIIILAGYYKKHQHIRTGKISVEAESISFRNMDELKFQEVFSRCIDVAIQYFTPQSTQEDIREYVEGVIRFS